MAVLRDNFFNYIKERFPDRPHEYLFDQADTEALIDYGAFGNNVAYDAGWASTLTFQQPPVIESEKTGNTCVVTSGQNFVFNGSTLPDRVTAIGVGTLSFTAAGVETFFTLRATNDYELVAGVAAFPAGPDANYLLGMAFLVDDLGNTVSSYGIPFGIDVFYNVRLAQDEGAEISCLVAMSPKDGEVSFGFVIKIAYPDGATQYINAYEDFAEALVTPVNFPSPVLYQSFISAVNELPTTLHEGKLDYVGVVDDWMSAREVFKLGMLALSGRYGKDYVFTNNAESVLATALTDSYSDDEFSVQVNTGKLFGLPGVGQSQKITLSSGSDFEIVHLIARDGDDCLVLRGQEATRAQNWSIGTTCEAYITEEGLSPNLKKEVDYTTPGTEADTYNSPSRRLVTKTNKGPEAIELGRLNLVTARSFVIGTGNKVLVSEGSDCATVVGADNQLTGNVAGRGAAIVGNQNKSHSAGYEPIIFGHANVHEQGNCLVFGQQNTLRGYGWANMILGYMSRVGKDQVADPTDYVYGSLALGYQSECLVSNSINLPAPSIAGTSATGSSIWTSGQSGAEAVLMSTVFDFTSPQNHSIPLNAQSIFYPTEFGVIITQSLNGAGGAGKEVSVRFGGTIDGVQDFAHYLVSTQITDDLSNSSARKAFTSLTTNDGCTAIDMAVTALAGSNSPGDLLGRLYVKGILMHHPEF